MYRINHLRHLSKICPLTPTTRFGNFIEMLSTEDIDTEVAAAQAELDLLWKLKGLCCCTAPEYNNCEQLSLDCAGGPQGDGLRSNVGQRIVDDDSRWRQPGERAQDWES
jgi:hypothetical protein